MNRKRVKRNEIMENKARKKEEREKRKKKNNRQKGEVGNKKHLCG